MDDLSLSINNPEYKIYKSKIEGLLVFERQLFQDERGYYQELARVPVIEKVLGRSLDIKQWAISYSVPGTLRGIHAEEQDKIITPLSGKIFIAIADIRPDSPTFGEYQSLNFDLTQPIIQKKSLIISNGLGNSFLVLGDQPVLYLYAVTEMFSGSEEKRAIRWNDPNLNIKWPEEPKIMSEDDKSKHPYLRDLYPEKFK
ncbi:MAG: hypothetical protein A2W22_04200 [Candidatus Levybacteria bacterium RBG_16_35_11]|nr:MAG: hypothetical protein A2W22_04200 [Candidatus Levybacteria bacterium RBG_16_35_11]